MHESSVYCCWLMPVCLNRYTLLHERISIFLTYKEVAFQKPVCVCKSKLLLGMRCPVLTLLRQSADRFI